MKEATQLVARRDRTRTVVEVGTVGFGRDLALIAGPCSVESLEQCQALGQAAKAAGANMFRGGAFKPRSSPYAFQGLGLEGLQILAQVREETGLPVVTEVLDPRDVSWVGEFADMLQIGTRNMHNTALLKEVGRCQKPVLLKRGMYSTYTEWMQSAEYILSEGNPNLVLCERGIRTFETFTRNTLDLSAVPAMRELSHLPVICDPTHGVGRASLVPTMALASVAAGADGVMLEVHDQPEQALSDGDQALRSTALGLLARRLLEMRQLMESWNQEEDR